MKKNSPLRIPYIVLIDLHRNGEGTYTEICRRIKISDLGGVSTTLKNLLRVGAIEKDIRIHKITAYGNQLLRSIVDVARATDYKLPEV